MQFTNFVGTAYDLRNTQFACQTCVNWFVEVAEGAPGKNAQPTQLTERPGMVTRISGLAGPSRGGYLASNGTLFWVFGSTLYTISTHAWTATSRGTISSGTGVCSFTDNGTDLFITAGSSVWTCLLSSGAPTALTTGLYASGGSSCAFLDNYVIFSRPNSNVFYWTDLIATTADGANFASAEANPDRVVAVFNNSQSLWIFGTKTTEIWTSNNGAQTSAEAFVRQGNALVETGCAAARTVKKINQTIMWLSSDDRGGPMVVIGNGYGAPARVSTFPLEQKWATFSQSDIANATADVIKYGGHFFYILNFPSADETYVYDLTVSQMLGKRAWHTWRTFDGNGTSSRHAGQGFVFVNGFYITGDNVDGNLYTLDADYGADGDASRSVIVERTTPHVGDEMKTFFHKLLTIDFATGTIALQSYDPQVMMQFSDDGGKTWSDEIWLSCGKIGEYALRVQFDQLGSAQSRVYRIRGSSDQYWACSGASIDVSPGYF